MRDHTAALVKLDDALSREPEFIEAHLLKFETYAEMNDAAGAEKSLIKALSINPDFFPNGHFFLADLKLRKGEYDFALVAFNKFLTYNRTNPNLQKEARRGADNCSFAIEAMKNPVPFDPQNIGPRVNSSYHEYFPSFTTDDRLLSDH